MAPGSAIPTRALVLCEDLGGRMHAGRVGEALAEGLAAGGAPPPEICAVTVPVPAGGARELLDGFGFDAHMRAARALILAVASLEEQTLAGSLAFEAATRARQSGVPCYAVTAADHLNAFDARILDLQAVFEARDRRALRDAGRRLAAIL